MFTNKVYYINIRNQNFISIEFIFKLTRLFQIINSIENLYKWLKFCKNDWPNNIVI